MRPTEAEIARALHTLLRTDLDLLDLHDIAVEFAGPSYKARDAAQIAAAVAKAQGETGR